MRKFSLAAALVMGLALQIIGPVVRAQEKPADPALEKPERIVILFDRSGSMNTLLDGVRKIDMGRTLFAALSKEFEGSEYVAVRFFAGGQADTREENCKATSFVLPFGSRKIGVLEALQSELWAKGKKTPLTHAIELAHDDLKGWTGPRRIIIISDGMDTCGQDPVPAAEEFGSGGMQMDVVGLGEAADVAGLAELGLSSGASFSLASNYGEFANAMGAMLPAMSDMPPSAMGDMPAGGAGGMPAGAGGSGSGGSGSGGSAGSGGGGGSGAAAGAAKAGAGGPAAAAAQAPAAGTGAGSSPPVLAPLPPDQPLKVEIKLPPDEAAAPKPVAVELILDVSGSMAAWIDGRAKMLQAMAALEKSIGALDAPHITVGFRAYGFDNTVEKTPEASCPNTDLLMPFAVGQSDNILAAARQLSPYGYTPIAASVTAAGEDLKAFADRRRQIVLITDGEETCGGDPIAAIRALADICVDTNLHIVGFDLDPKARAEMQANAAAGCGLYIDAPTAFELEEAMLKITEVVADKIDLDWGRFVNPVQGGASIDEAVTLDEGAYTFTQHLNKGEEQYFFVPLKKAQRLRIIVTAQGRIISLNKDGKLVEMKGFDFSNFWAEFKQADGEKIAGPYRQLTFRSAEPGEQKEAQILDMTGDGVYIHVRANAMMINKDTRFDLFIDEAGDVVAEYEAPDDLAPDIRTVNVYQDVVGHIGLQDRSDSFEITGIQDGSEELGVVINFTDPAFKYRVLLKNLDTERTIKRFNGLTGRQALFFDLPPDTRDVMLQIFSQMAGNKAFTSYTFVVED